jgi:hypothetical protein
MHEAATDDRADIDWDQLRPELGRMMMELRDADHDAIWLRFFEGRSFAEIGTALNLTENTARMRVERALAKLRAQLGRRGVTSTTAALTAALAVQPGEAAPAGLVASVTGAALAGVAGGSEAVVTAQFFALNKIQVGILSAVLGVGLVTGLMQARTNRRLWTEFNARRAEHARLEEQPPAASERPAAASVEAGELERLRARVALLKARPDGVVDAEMKPRGAWQNAGHATPEAAMETLAWATETGELDTLAESYSFNETTKARAEAFFASLSDAARTKYRTPERLFAPLLAEGWKQISPAAYQVSELIDQGANQVELQLWTRSTAGVERDGGRMPFVHEAEGWRFGRIGLDLDLARFDPVTGEFLPERK